MKLGVVMKTSEQLDKLAEALSKAQGQMVNPEKNKTAKVEGVTKAGKQYSYEYKYADLPQVFEAARKALSENGITHVCGMVPNGDSVLLSMRLIHSSGQWLESEITVFGDDDKKLAAAITYFKRYLFISLVGMAAEEDTDGYHETNLVHSRNDGNEASKQPLAKPAPKPSMPKPQHPAQNTTKEQPSLDLPRF